LSPLSHSSAASGDKVGRYHSWVWKIGKMTQHTVTRRRGFRLFSYIAEIISELRKVVWLTRREAAYLTVLVLIVTICAAIVLGALDFGFTEFVDKVFIGG
jgi:preprotein translocase subunit SecE